MTYDPVYQTDTPERIFQYTANYFSWLSSPTSSLTAWDIPYNGNVLAHTNGWYTYYVSDGVNSWYEHPVLH